MESFEIEKEVEERVSQILQELTKEPLYEVLSYAIRGEEEAVELYTFLSKRLEEPHAKKRFEEFIMAEKGHKEKIIRIFNELFPDKEPGKIKAETWIGIATKGKPAIKTAKSYLDILKIAVESEKLAESIYNFIGRNIPDEQYKAIFFELAMDEKRHYDFVKSQYLFYKRAKAEESVHDMINDLLQK
ncbi:hypothetical protein PAP_09750 [Palaeococcus pacificus DY20341]|uniref:Rubrerythrin diiron-binding domain-containing protein n=1 Tax=Palaeococcus pacificus DY20341 TaxID=1343739 RepID=A0A075LUD0_9EURY|nr:ferritin family protein [Palaeococcus pacificus]AIF70325.1 hypothetical protein PAP_09750 [Palaeococcus pacificus DY20341]